MAQAGNPRAQTQTAIAQPQVGMSQLGQAAGNFGSSMLGGGQTQTQVQMPQPQQAQVQMPQPQQAQVQMPQPQQAQVQMPQPQQAQGQGGKGGAATGAPQQAQQPNVYQQSAQGLTDAMAGARAGMQYQPMNVQAAYYNPSTMQGVGNIGMQNVYGAQQSTAANTLQQQLANQGALNQAGQFGAQQGLQAAMANQGANLTAQQSTAANTLQQQLANQGALNQAGQFGAQQGLQAQLANQGMNFNTQQQNMANALQTQQANMGALNQAGQYNTGQNLQAQMANQSAGLAGAGTRLGAAGQLGGFANQGFNMGQAINQQQWTQGAAQQALNQQLINAAMGQYQGFTGAPNASLGLPMQALGAANMGQQTQTGSYNPGIFDYLSLGAGLGGSYLNAQGMANYGRGWG
jgi:hypothetical protein